MYQVCIATPSDVYGPSAWHSIATGRTLALAMERARVRLDTYGPMNPGRIFYRRSDDGARYPLISV
jgi:hypothetical protein